MPRQESQNTFNDGMIKDVNPIIQPKTSMTDCLNGTLITNNGNELSLQNDMGNIKLENCSLPAHYIPVGLKEYGDILYVVSYNPIENKVEFGSFPSPVSYANTATDHNVTIKTIKGCGLKKYTEIAREFADIQLFMDPNDPQKYLINPGDQYFLPKQTLDKFLYEDLQWYIVGTDHKVTEIFDVECDTLNGIDQYKYLKVSNPGWLGVKSTYAYIDDFKVRELSTGTNRYNDQYSIKLYLELVTSDERFKTYEQNAGRLRIACKSALNNKTTTISDFTKKENPDGSITFYTYYYITVSKNVDSDRTEILTLMPYMAEPNEEGNLSTSVEYDNLLYTHTISIPSNISLAYNPIDIGNNIFKYTITDEALTLTFSTDGVIYSYGEELPILKYSIYEAGSPNSAIKEGTITEWNLDGNTTYSVDFDDTFTKENLYVITFKIFIKEGETSALYTSSHTIVASELMNEFSASDDKFDKIIFNEWINKYPISVKNNTVTLNSEGEALSEIIARKSQSADLTKWIKGAGTLYKYDRFILEEEAAKLKDISLKSYASGSVNIKPQLGTKLLIGKLWGNFNSKISYKGQSNIITSDGTVDDSKITTTPISIVASSTAKYELVRDETIQYLRGIDLQETSLLKKVHSITLHFHSDNGPIQWGYEVNGTALPGANWTSYNVEQEFLRVNKDTIGITPIQLYFDFSGISNKDVNRDNPNTCILNKLLLDCGEETLFEKGIWNSTGIGYMITILKIVTKNADGKYVESYVPWPGVNFRREDIDSLYVYDFVAKGALERDFAELMFSIYTINRTAENFGSFFDIQKSETSGITIDVLSTGHSLDILKVPEDLIYKGKDLLKGDNISLFEGFENLNSQINLSGMPYISNIKADIKQEFDTTTSGLRRSIESTLESVDSSLNSSREKLELEKSKYETDFLQQLSDEDFTENSYCYVKNREFEEDMFTSPGFLKNLNGNPNPKEKLNLSLDLSYIQTIAEGKNPIHCQIELNLPTDFTKDYWPRKMMQP